MLCISVQSFKSMQRTGPDGVAMTWISLTPMAVLAKFYQRQIDRLQTKQRQVELEQPKESAAFNKQPVPSGTPFTKENQIRCQLIEDFDKFVRIMCLQYIYHDKETEPHPFHV